ncbi:MAG: hypothetical protein MUF25_27905 [Pirellulaceae bacterium]|jgi:hypothetical protein|nr:hypothetical protein [Pirellulaceae bacterium]
MSSRFLAHKLRADHSSKSQLPRQAAKRHGCRARRLLVEQLENRLMLGDGNRKGTITNIDNEKGKIVAAAASLSGTGFEVNTLSAATGSTQRATVTTSPTSQVFSASLAKSHFVPIAKEPTRVGMGSEAGIDVWFGPRI